MILNLEPPRYAREHGVNLMTFDNVSELEKIEMYFPEAKLVMRIAPDDSHSLMRFGTKFGVHPDDCADLLEMASEMKLAVVGVRCESFLFFFPLLVLTYFSFLFFITAFMLEVDASTKWHTALRSPSCARCSMMLRRLELSWSWWTLVADSRYVKHR